MRLWPLSRNAKPKQFLNIIGTDSLIQQTVKRCSGHSFDPMPIVVSGEGQRFLVAEQMRAIDVKSEIILEPMRRDSCAAVAAGCLVALERSADAVVLVLAADHHIVETEAFVAAVLNARIDADQGHLTTFGISPTHPATGYGYIKPGEQLRPNGSHKIQRFVEKPDLETAKTYLQDGYFWNSGNFLFRADRFIEELGKYAPMVLEAVRQSVGDARRDVDFLRLDSAAFARSPQISIDYAVMEKTSRAAVFPVKYQWNDIGTWDALYDILNSDALGNALVGKCVIVGGQNNLVYSPHHVTAMMDVEDLIVVTTHDAVLVARRGQSEKLKVLVSELKARNYSEAD